MARSSPIMMVGKRAVQMSVARRVACSMAVVEAIYQAAETKSVVKVEQVG